MLVKNSAYRGTWEADAEDKRARLRDAIDEQWHLPTEVLLRAEATETITGHFMESLLDDDTRKVTALDSEALLRALRDEELSARQVVEAFCKRTAIASQLNNNVVEICFTTALKQADMLDEALKTTGKIVGPLHGLPVTLKDQFHVPGYETAMGYIGWLHTQAGESSPEYLLESELVRELRTAGAVVIAKTSNAQTLWCGETNNNIVGYCRNPCKQSLSAGGSSGGQAALQALGGSPVGFGTDIGGSVSMPAAFNGLYSIKPSHGRLSYKDAANSSPGQALIKSVVGIMGGSSEDLRIMFQALLGTKPWLRDSSVLPLPFNHDSVRMTRERAQHGLLTFAVLEDDGFVAPHPPIQRGLRLVKKALESKSYRVLAWQPPSHRKAGMLHQAVTNADGAADIFARLRLSGEPLVPQLRDEFGDTAEPSMSLTDFYKLHGELQEYKDSYTEYWSSTASLTQGHTPVDAVIMPAATTCAVRPGQFYHYDYNTLPNTLDCPALVIPVTRAVSAVDKFPAQYEPRNGTEKQSYRSYDPKSYDGAPVGVQILTRRLEEEKLLTIAQLVVEALQQSKEDA